MPIVNFTDCNGEQHEVEVPVGVSVMEAAFDNDIEGIEADCGGACSCATCHVYVDELWFDSLPEMDALEDAMLDSAYDRQDNSRLTCQIDMTDELDGLVVTVAEN